MDKQALIEGYKADFRQKTGEEIKIAICSKWQGKASFTDSVSFWVVAKMVCDFTSWKSSEVFTKSQTTERVFRRGLIDFISMSNGCTLNECAKNTNRDHTTIMHSVKTFEDKLEKDMYVRKVLRETMEFINTNYQDFYKDKPITREDIQ